MRATALGPHHSEIHPLITNHTGPVTGGGFPLKLNQKPFFVDKGQTRRQLERLAVFVHLIILYFLTVALALLVNTHFSLHMCTKHIYHNLLFVMSPRAQTSHVSIVSHQTLRQVF